MEIRFYHLQRSTVEQALPQLLGKALEQSLRAVVVCGGEDRLQALDAHLWTYNPNSFLPHGTAADGHAAHQPVWLTLSVENPNGATALFLLDGAELADVPGFTLACDVFDGGDEDSLAAARARWKRYKEAGYALTYWQQGERGGWEKKA